MRRLVLVPLVAVLLAGCGKGAGGDLPLLPLSATGGGEKAMAADMMRPYRNVRYELAEGVKPDADHATAYRFDQATVDDARRFGDAFGLTGEPRAEDDGWSFGHPGEVVSNGVNPASAHIGRNGVFSLNDDRAVASSGVACASVAAPDQPPVPCDAPTTTSTTPTTVAPASFDAAEAKRFALAKLKAAGVDLPDAKVTVPAADGYFFSVHVEGRIDGQPVDDLTANVTIDQDKRVTSASGVVADLETVGSYELASLQEAVDRLNNHVSTGPEPMIASGEPGGEPVVVKLTAVRIGLGSTYDRDRLWLTPTYVFTTDEGHGATVSVAAAADKYFPTTTTSPTYDSKPPVDGGAVPPNPGSGGGSTGNPGSVEPAPPAPNSPPNCVSTNDPIPAQVCTDKASYKAGETVHFTITASDPDRQFQNDCASDGVSAEYGDDSGGDVHCAMCTNSVPDGPGKIERTRDHTYAKPGKYAVKFTIHSGASCGNSDPRDSTATLTLGIAVS